ncbi:uncharacterized protein LOC121982515 [Zingiber officinale]|uniref:uncharacterized protein LOC121982515 n=1 Tax=Zingiber officinale TaxID=94328 RepID=UPI001C4BE220|nr:uncharacterized protein LOC121982515 [Zingiber officinale]
MSPSSPAVAKICFNSQCKEPLPDPPPARRKGWRLCSGEIAELCDRCSCTFEQGNFCETYHSDDRGWRNCEACGKRVHCGCIVSLTDYVLLDADGVDCNALATKPSATVSREKEDLPKKDVSPRKQLSDLSPMTLVGKYSYQQIKHWMMSMSVYTLARENNSLWQQISESAVSCAPEQIKALYSQFQETQRPAKVELEKPSKLKTAQDICKAKLQFEMTIRANMEIELDEQIAKSSQLSAQLQELKATRTATKESKLAAERAERDSLRSDLATIKNELIAVATELAMYREEKDECFETWKKDLFKTREYNVLIARCITKAIILGAKGGMEQLKVGGFLNSDVPANCLDLKSIISSCPPDHFHDLL